MKRDLDKAASLLQRQAHQWGIDVGSEQLSLLARYADLLTGYELANVTGARDSIEVLVEHIPDSLSGFLTGELGSGKSLIDVGAGGGLPAIPLRIACPGLKVTMLEATAKKVRFLEEATEEMNLNDLGAVNNRAEVLGRNLDYRDSFDIAVSRAVGGLPLVVEYCAPFVKAGGAIIAMKGSPEQEEVSAGTVAAEELGAGLERSYTVDFLPELVQKDRTLFLFRKMSRTPDNFPRRVGVARQKPLGDQRRQ